jgi:two-component system, cell cycle sensor histidine kinase and response regulator CckA
MPEMNGQDLSKIILSICPNIKTLFMSGYTSDAFTGNSNLLEYHFIKKPFTILSLSTKVLEMLRDGQ